jgi:GrpB-like predicted nucleotidyltransferase (UPF0157 family)
VSNEQRAGEAAVEVVEPDVTWPARFIEERTLLERSLAPWLAGPIEHIGSTAVPGLAAKPVIDMMAPVSTLDASRPAIEVLQTVGYQYFPYKPDVMHWFCKPSAAFRTHHLHLVPLGSRLWRERLAFRDALRSDAALADEYGALKRELAVRFRFDREGYTEAKSSFVRRVLAGCGL